MNIENENFDIDIQDPVQKDDGELEFEIADENNENDLLQSDGDDFEFVKMNQTEKE